MQFPSSLATIWNVTLITLALNFEINLYEVISLTAEVSL